MAHTYDLERRKFNTTGYMWLGSIPAILIITITVIFGFVLPNYYSPTQMLEINKALMFGIGKWYPVALFAFIALYYLLVKSTPTNVVLDVDRKRLTCDGIEYYLNRQTVSFARFVPFMSNSTSGTVAKIKENGNELNICFYGVLLSHEQYSDERSSFTKVFSKDQTLLNELVQLIGHSPIFVSVDHEPTGAQRKEVEVEISNPATSYAWVAILVIVPIAIAILSQYIGIAESLRNIIVLVCILGGSLFTFWIRNRMKRTVVNIANNTATLATAEGKVLATCNATDAKVTLGQYHQSSRYGNGYTCIIVNIDFAGQRKVSFSINDLDAKLIGKSYVSGNFFPTVQTAPYVAAKPLLEYYNLVGQIDF